MSVFSRCRARAQSGCSAIQQSFHLRLVFYAVPTVLFLFLVALMVVPIGIPQLDHVSSYWWANPDFAKYVGQNLKSIWYSKAVATFCMCALGAIFCGSWYRLLGKKLAPWKLMTFAYVCFVTGAISSQFLVVGSWETLTTENLKDNWGPSPSFITVLSRIDTLENYLQDIPKYAGTDGKLLGVMESKAAGYLLPYYFLDQLFLQFSSLVDLGVPSLGERAISLAVCFTLITGLFLIPLFYLCRRFYSLPVSQLVVVISASLPMTAWGFSHYMAWNHNLMLPVTAGCLLLLIKAIQDKSRLCLLLSLLASAGVGFILFESFVLMGFLGMFFLFYTFGFSWRAFGIAALASFGILVAAGLISFALDLRLFQMLWDRFAVGFVGHQLSLTFTRHGPLLYVLSLFNNLYEFLFWLGIALSLQWVLSAYSLLRAQLSPTLVRSLFQFLVFFVAALLLSGVTTESGRNWAFLVPVFLVTVPFEFARNFDERQSRTAATALFALQWLQLVVCRSVFFTV